MNIWITQLEIDNTTQSRWIFLGGEGTHAAKIGPSNWGGILAHFFLTFLNYFLVTELGGTSPCTKIY